MFCCQQGKLPVGTESHSPRFDEAAVGEHHGARLTNRGVEDPNQLRVGVHFREEVGEEVGQTGLGVLRQSWWPIATQMWRRIDIFLSGRRKKQSESVTLLRTTMQEGMCAVCLSRLRELARDGFEQVLHQSKRQWGRQRADKIKQGTSSDCVCC